MKIARAVPVVVVSLAAAWLGGCADRRLLIDSAPQGATVYLNDAEVGVTPCEVNFTYFGVYDVRLHKQGYEPLVTTARADAPVHEWPGIDLAVMVVPGTKTTRVNWKFDLKPADADVDALLKRASEMRETVVTPAE